MSLLKILEIEGPCLSHVIKALLWTTIWPSFYLLVLLSKKHVHILPLFAQKFRNHWHIDIQYIAVIYL